MMEQSNKKISVIMSVYNCEQYLRESIDSILAQTYENWEFVICNDASTDGTQAILDEYKAKYPEKFILVANDTNKRLAFSLNHCLRYATGDYIARMDGDDIATQDRFEKEVLYLQEHPDCDLVGTAMQQFDENGPIQIVSKPENVDKFSMRTMVPFNHATIMTYRYVYEKCGGYTVAKRTNRAQDYDLWFRFFAEGFHGHNLPDALYLVREDMNAIKRRTFKVRWYAYQTTRIGFRMLGFPKRWLIKEFFTTLFKSLIPYRLMHWYRKLQAKNG